MEIFTKPHNMFFHPFCLMPNEHIMEVEKSVEMFHANQAYERCFVFRFSGALKRLTFALHRKALK